MGEGASDLGAFVLGAYVLHTQWPMRRDGVQGALSLSPETSPLSPSGINSPSCGIMASEH